MKKSLFLIGAFLLAAVFMSGCVAQTDEITGTWYNAAEVTGPSGDLFSHCFLVFSDDGTGKQLIGYATDSVYETVPFTWKNAGNGKYQIEVTGINGDSAVFTFTLADGKLTDESGLVFHRPSAEEALIGIWVTDERTSIGSQDNVKGMVAFGEDGKALIIGLGPEVTGKDNVLRIHAAWEYAGGIIKITGPDGGVFEYLFKDNRLTSANGGVYHKITADEYIMGIWIGDDAGVVDGKQYRVILVWKEDGNGVELWVPYGGDSAEFTYTFTWKETADKTYQADYGNNEIWTFTLEGLKLNDRHSLYSKVGMGTFHDYISGHA